MKVINPLKGKTDRVIILGKVNSSQDGVIVDGGGFPLALLRDTETAPKSLK